MVKPLSFKGDKKPKKRKRTADTAGEFEAVGEKELAFSGSGGDPTIEDDNSWVTAEASGDIVGPIVIVLPSEPPTCIACDTNGKVFASTLENIIDGDPSTAEPHDVRQVWVANRLAGTEKLSFKGYHAKYLSADRYGNLSADKEAMSPLESFLVVSAVDSSNAFQFKTSEGQFITIIPSTSSNANTRPEIRADATSLDFNAALRVRMQARFKPRLKASKEEKLSSRISRKELERAVGRRLPDEEVRRLKKARRDGDYHEVLLNIKVKNKHDKYS